MDKAQIIEFDPPVKDEDGTELTAYDRYVRGEVTVLCNQSGAKCRLPDLKSPLGDIWLAPGECIDLEEVARPSVIEHCGLTLMLRPNANGYVTFTIHDKLIHKGTDQEKPCKPVGKSPETQDGRYGRETGFDRALDDVQRREDEEDERTKKKTPQRTGEGGSLTSVGTPPRTAKPSRTPVPPSVAKK